MYRWWLWLTGGEMHDRLPPDALRNERIRILQDFYLQYLVEDPIDGTSFDCDVLDFFDDLRKKYEEYQ